MLGVWTMLALEFFKSFSIHTQICEFLTILPILTVSCCLKQTLVLSHTTQLSIEISLSGFGTLGSVFAKILFLHLGNKFYLFLKDEFFF